VSPIGQQQQPGSVTASSARKVYELWRELDGTYSFLPREGDATRPDADLVWTVEADTWEEAVAAQRQYLGWGG
jgi:hypothetical protein